MFCTAWPFDFDFWRAEERREARLDVSVMIWCNVCDRDVTGVCHITLSRDGGVKSKHAYIDTVAKAQLNAAE